MDLDRFLGELAAWAEERDPGFETIAYGDHPDQVADVRRGGERHAIVIHGGFWRPAFTRATTRALAVDLALRGWTTWNVEYRRTGARDTFADLEAALDLAPGAVAIGHSAGGHLALWAAGTGKVARAVSLAGVTDLVRAAREGIGANAVAEFAGDDPPADADPMRRLPLTVPVLLVHGTEDDRVPVHYSRAFAEASGAEYLELPGSGHFEVIDPRTPEWARIVERLDHFVLQQH
jgi:pimeloyl-ACP methyl ester carboxylesterase